MKIAVFHYHLKPGGVTEVIAASVQILMKNLPQITELWIVSGEPENASEVMEKISAGLPNETLDKLHMDILNGIGYKENISSQIDARTLADRIESRYDENFLYWIHNYHIGKNPAFTKALMIIAKRASRKLLLHIHDFPECGRNYNLMALNTALDRPPYPSGNHIRYAVINSRDKTMLADSGLGDSVFLLNNPVQLDALNEKTDIRKDLQKIATHYIPDSPLFLYPVRAIRRKNIFEAAIFCLLFHEQANLVITLPGNSRQEKAYSDLVKNAYRESLIPGVWCPENSGNPVLSYPQLCASCDAVISTSIQEGFGYLFVNALHWQKPLMARYLEILDGLLHLWSDYPRRLWAELRVPIDKDIAEKTKEAYRNKIRELNRRFPETSPIINESATSKIVTEKTADISLLSVSDQIVLLKKAAKDENWLRESRSINKELLESCKRTLQSPPMSMDKKIQAEFGPENYTRTFEKIIASFRNNGNIANPERIRKGIMKTFARLDYLRLIYDY